MGTPFKLMLLALGSTAAAAALAAGAWVSVPSTPSVDQRLVINGGNLGAHTSVRLTIEHPDGAVVRQVGVADANGNLRIEYPLGAYGRYVVKVFDERGRLISSGIMGYMR